MNIKIISDISGIDIEKWYDFLLNHPNGNVFQSPYMFKVYENSSNHQPIIFLATIGDEILGILVSFIQNQLSIPFTKLSSRAIIWGGPLAKDDDPEIIKQLITTHDNYLNNKIVYTQIRNLSSTGKVKDIFLLQDYSFKEHLNILIDLNKSESELWENINSKGRNKIRIAQKRKCLFSVTQDIESLEKCYDILKSVYQRVRLPLAEKLFFIKLPGYSDEQVRFKIFTANYDGNIIGCRLALLFKNCIYDYYAGSHRKYNQIHPNDFLIWEILKWGKENGYGVFDFGGAGIPEVSYGVRDYKKKFGGEIVNYGRYEKINSKFKYSIAKLGFRFWQLMIR